MESPPSPYDNKMTMTEAWLQSLARRLVCRSLDRFRQFQVRLRFRHLGPDEPDVLVGQPGDEEPVVLIVDDFRFYARFLLSMELGMAEALMLGEVRCSDLVRLSCRYKTNIDAFGSNGFTTHMIRLLATLCLDKGKTLDRLRQSLISDPDEPNEVFTNILSNDMNFSSALWSGESDESLESAQRRKVQTIIDKASISSSHHVLDIGCGWGNLAIEAARRTGCRVTGVTLSTQEKLFAEARIRAAGLHDKIRIVVCDYRRVPRVKGGYDRVISVEMLQYVARHSIRAFFGEVSDLLKPQTGVVVTQAITTHKNSSSDTYAESFLARYIFPRGHLHTIHELLTAMNDGSDGQLEVETVESIGPHYVRTLQHWQNNLETNWLSTREALLKTMPDADEDLIEAYRRRWECFLSYFQAGFRTRWLGNYILSAGRPFSSGNRWRVASTSEPDRAIDTFLTRDPAAV
ncbi:cyclopropane-fatty-acyl-phospholipid synthase [Ophiocordyceps camponoti-floridani]|uniref:Cyclopropane-fatty-acyl-phospholipid synthase n=1 Tax=Ophiocordyceps camponoti-floridani TaxID=2030778 RepID=A0A8H4Q8T7_9HYPO|nr:cyclopropane-fatty-acyl-phospholipid synthase [Ophiocordyceps camponoti-floridani]